MDPNRLRYAAATGIVLIRWEGARQPTVWIGPAPDMDAREARLELARRYLHTYGPATPEAFGGWAGIGGRSAVVAFEALGESLTPVRTPVGEAWILGEDEAVSRARARPDGARPAAPERRLLLPPPGRRPGTPGSRTPARRRELWTSRVWPGALLVDGEIAGTWRRAGAALTVQTWRPLSAAERDAVEAEAASLPLPGIRGRSSSAGMTRATAQPSVIDRARFLLLSHGRRGRDRS